MRTPKAKHSLLQNKDFMKLWMGQSISNFGSQFTFIALPLLATIILEASPFQMGLITSLGFLPNLLFGLFAGAWVDRLKRKPILITANLVSAGLLLAIPILYFGELLNINILYVIQFMLGIGSLFSSISSSTYMPTLIKKEELLEGNSKFQFSNSVARITGSGLGGGLVQLLSAPIVILIDAITFIVSALFLSRIKSEEIVKESKKEERNMVREIREGIQIVFSSKIIRSILYSSTCYNFFYSMFLPLFILFVSKDLELNSTIIGLIFSVGGLGALIGSTVAKKAGTKLGIGRLLSLVNILTGISIIVMAISTIFTPMMTVSLLLVAQVILSACATIYSINAVSLRTAITPNHLLGRTNASMHTIGFGVLAIGPLLGGAIAELLGNGVMIFICGVGIALSTLFIQLSPIRSITEIPKEEVIKSVA